jgi:DNA repair protein RadC
MPADLDADAVHPNGHRRIDHAGRPRERLLQYGAHTLTDAELVSLLLSAGANTAHLAERLLETVGGIPGLARWHPEALCRLSGLGEVTAARLVAALALPQRRTTVNAVTVTGPADLVPVFRPLLAGLPHERLAVAVCDRRTRAVRAVADGTTDACLLPVRDIVTTVSTIRAVRQVWADLGWDL